MTRSNTFNLDRKLALVTGASHGIGAAAARILAEHGAHVVLSSRKEGACEEVAETIRASGGKASSLVCHVGEMDDIAAVFKAIEKEHGRLDILVNNAATNPYFGPIVDTDPAAFQKTVDVNIRGYFFMCALGAKLMAKNGGGSIINVYSVNGAIPAAMQGIYSITKTAVLAMTKAFARECAAQGVRVNAILPGATDTKFAAALVQNPAILKIAMQHTPMNRVAQPEEIVGAILYLASPAASYTTGAEINVDGGYLTV